MPRRAPPTRAHRHGGGRVPGAAWQSSAEIRGERGKGAVGPSPGGRPPAPQTARGPDTAVEAKALGSGDAGQGCLVSDSERGQDRLSRSYLISASLWYFMSEQAIPMSTGEQERSANAFEGLTPGERQRLDESMRRNEKLMKRLAEM